MTLKASVKTPFTMDNNIIAFNGDNFFTWQSKIMYLLMLKGLWYLINDAQINALENNKALGLIASYLGDDVISHITGIKNAKKAWIELNKIFGTESKSSKINLLMQFYKLNKIDEESMAAHFNKFKALKQQLWVYGKILLNRVEKPPFDSLVSTLQNLEKTLQEVEAALREYKSKNKSMQAAPSSSTIK